MYDKKKLMEELERDEDRVNHAYLDSEGYLTIGIGHLIDKKKGGSIPDFIIDALLEYDIEQKEQDLDHYLPFWRNLSNARQRVLLTMAFNLGVGSLMGFKRFIAALRATDYNAASVEMLDSKWARQVGKRATRLAEIMRTDKDV